MRKTVHAPSGVQEVSVTEREANEEGVQESFIPKVPGNQSRNNNVEKCAEKLVMPGMKSKILILVFAMLFACGLQVSEVRGLNKRDCIG